MKLIFFEKPDQLNYLKNVVDNEDTYCIFIKCIGGFHFDYNKYQDIPQYKFTGITSPFNQICQINQGKINKESFEEIDFIIKSISLLKQADEIIINVDIDHTGIRSIILYFEKVFNININNYNISVMHIFSYNDVKLKEAYLNRISFKKNKVINNKILTYLKKDYLDYHFNYKSNDKWSSLMTGESLLTRNGIEVLLMIKNNENKFKNGIDYLINIMIKNTIGSPPSQMEIITGLIKNGLIENKNNSIILTKNGYDLINHIPTIFNGKDSLNFVKIMNRYIMNDSIKLKLFKEHVNDFFNKYFI